MLLEQTLDKLYKMKLYGMHASVKEKLSRPDHAELSFTDMLGLITDDEWLYRENKHMDKRLSNAKFKEKRACLEDVDYDQKNRTIKKSQILELGQNRWITQQQNVIITGASGSGKSFLAQALGYNACRNGFAVHYIRTSKLLFNLLKSRADGSFQEYIKKTSKYDVLIIDDFGLGSIDEQAKTDFLEIIEERCGTKATIVTSQLDIKDWHAYLGGALVADAILDRLLHNAHKMHLAAKDSLRKTKSTLTHEGHYEK